MVVLLLDAGESLDLGPDVMGRLTALGVTGLSVARDADTVAIVLEGWAFDPDASATAAAVILAPRDNARALRPVLQMSVQG